ncbi:MAG: ABC-2 transporter permease [Lachnospiraceae bacterium]|nr:ABC-2 transporter permease [Lachnospiraceae bacterium]
MKGLIIKDVMCLKKQLMIFAYVLIGVLVVSVMYVLSARFGNIALAGKEMLATDQLSGIDVKNLGSIALVLFMLLPPATVCDMVNVFEADGKAGFHKVAASLPVSLRKRVLSKYLTIYTLFLIGAFVDILIAVLLSGITDLITLKDFLGIIVSSVSVMCIYSAFVIFFCILLGCGKEMYAQILSIVTMLLVVIIINFNTIKGIIISIVKSGEEDSVGDISFIWNMLDFIKERSYVFLIAAVFNSVASFVLSWIIAERKRGVI